MNEKAEIDSTRLRRLTLICTSSWPDLGGMLVVGSLVNYHLDSIVIQGRLESVRPTCPLGPSFSPYPAERATSGAN